MESLLQLLGAGASGGVFGILGSLGARALSIWERKEARRDRQIEITHEQKQWEHQLSLISAQSDASALTESIKGSWAGLAASHQSDAAIGGSYKWVSAIRSLVRPTLTFGLWAIYCGAAVLVWSANSEHLTGLDRGGLIRYFWETISFTATTATTWWFGDRAMGKPRGGNI